MKLPYRISRRPSKRHGVAIDLYFRWKGQRYRPLLGYNLTDEEAHLKAIQIIQGIQNKPKATVPILQPNITLLDLEALYWRSLETRHRVELHRPRVILRRHLLPFFKDRPLCSLSAEDGLRYVYARQRAGAAAGTIRREWGVLMRILNLGVRYGKINQNTLRAASEEMPQAIRRERVATVDELMEIHKVANKTDSGRDLWRIATVSLHTGLRQAKAVFLDRQWIGKRTDGYWLTLPPSRSRLKGTPKALPLNRIVLAALAQSIPSVQHGRLFPRWNNLGAMMRYWAQLCRHAKVVDLHFHDLRHTFATWLQNLGVDYEIRQALLGHRMLGMTAQYSHGGPEWDHKLRDAVTTLEKAYPLSYSLSYRSEGVVIGERKLLKDGAEEQNRTVSEGLEKADETEGDQ